ncbi:MAG: hypothetical protein GWN79_05325, partial [Actinobacteria bacterium]|nr:hypothetical protein [Actinomycetota bacterium]NIS30136.1 hypothetical protein [Actinomycetota bacterium]NIU18539.1 hypothetical protein [Actinomycetota bacterium]NIU65390.1 hypothetical protein [Actinomycetota bacterium]NIV55016.1 hypothetical protein [Actinomycetota bacterium]
APPPTHPADTDRRPRRRCSRSACVRSWCTAPMTTWFRSRSAAPMPAKRRKPGMRS